MTSLETRSYAKAIKVKEGLIKIREDIIKAYGIGKNVKATEIVKKYNLYPKTMSWLIEIGAVSEGDNQGKDGRKLKWVYEGNPNGVVDQQLVERIIKEERNYSKARKEVRESLRSVEKEERKPTMKKLLTGNLATINSVIVWVDEELTKEEQIPGYLRSSTKLMYQTIRQVMSELKPSIQAVRDAIDNLNL